MGPFDDDPDFGDASSDEDGNNGNEAAEQIEEPEEPEPEDDGDGDDDDDDGDDGQGGSGDSPSQGKDGDAMDQDADADKEDDASKSQAPVHAVRPEALTATDYDIVPTIAAPQSTSINTICATPDMRWVFSGGSDGYIRRFNWVDTVNSKLMLTVAQRHPFVDSVVKAGVLSSYWENEDPNMKPGEDNQSLSPVYSLAVHSQGLWLLSGLESGGINLQSVRHDEGKRILCLKQHTSAVSVLSLAKDEKSALSGSWDKLVLDWDLNTGQVKRTFDGDGGQISALEMRPLSSLSVPETVDSKEAGDTFSSDGDKKPRLGSGMTNGHAAGSSQGAAGPGGSAPSPIDSLFGGNDNDSLFGDDDVPMGVSSTILSQDDDGFNQPLSNGLQGDVLDTGGDVKMEDAADDKPYTNGISGSKDKSVSFNEADKGDVGDDVTMGASPPTETQNSEVEGEGPKGLEPVDDTIFLAASIDGTIRIWDKRQSTAAARISPRNSPPWCTGACWSPDGNFIYAGRRNGTVEEFSLHKGLRYPERTFKFPNGSGPVTAVRAMPNGRHLVCASYDILRLYDLQHTPTKQSSVPFLIVPGHRTGVISQLYIDPTCRFLISTAGNRGWEGNTTQVLLGYEINI